MTAASDEEGRGFLVPLILKKGFVGGVASLLCVACCSILALRFVTKGYGGFTRERLGVQQRLERVRH
ncbi:hypothetical protein HYQ46_000654 [Verticillium longisporum]|nr:hypothetical protein HYQ46_000654 [Verticillium longisporum]